MARITAPQAAKANVGIEADAMPCRSYSVTVSWRTGVVAVSH